MENSIVSLTPRFSISMTILGNSCFLYQEDFLAASLNSSTSSLSFMFFTTMLFESSSFSNKGSLCFNAFLFCVSNSFLQIFNIIWAGSFLTWYTRDFILFNFIFSNQQCKLTDTNKKNVNDFKLHWLADQRNVRVVGHSEFWSSIYFYILPSEYLIFKTGGPILFITWFAIIDEIVFPSPHNIIDEIGPVAGAQFNNCRKDFFFFSFLSSIL